jgi:hypothetical protein
VSYEFQQLVTGHGVDLGWSRFSHFQDGVVLRNPVFDFDVKLFCLDDDLFCFCVGRNIGESVVDSISLSSTRLKIVGILVCDFTQHQFRALQGHAVVSDLAYDPIPRTGYGHIRSLERSVVGSGESPICRKASKTGVREVARSGIAYCLIPSWRFCVSGLPYLPTSSSKSLWLPFTNCFRPRKTAARKWSPDLIFSRNSSGE